MYSMKRSFLRTQPRCLQLFLPLVARQPLSTYPPLQDDNDGRNSSFPPSHATRHHDLASFLKYAERSGLKETSTIYVGTHYEYTVSSTLAQYGIQAVRVGGVSDHGIDLLGTWTLPSRDEKLKVIFQCKGGAQRVTPSLIRELEGSFIGAPVGWRGEGVIAFLVSEATASKGVREGMGRSRWPMGFISCSKDGVVRQMIWNQRAVDEGLGDVDVTIRHADVGNDESRLVLTYKGKRVPEISKANDVPNTECP